MGWTSYYVAPRRVAAEIISNYEWSNESGTRKVIASSINVVKGVAYLAVEHTPADGGDRQVWAGVALVRYTPKARDGYNFSIKQMDETVGPCEVECPARILDLLTPTNYEYAVQWRAACRANIAAKKSRRKAMKDGAKLVLPGPTRFTDGSEHTVLTIRKVRTSRGGKLVTGWRFEGAYGIGYRPSKRLIAASQVVEA